MNKVSMQDIATALGISKMTVSKCFKNSEDISEDTKQTILQKAEEMGYEYKPRIKHRIAVLFSAVYVEPNEKFYSGLYKCLTEHEIISGITFPLFSIKKEEESQTILNPEVLKNDAIMLLGQFSKRFVNRIIAIGKPVLCLDFQYRGMNADSVVSNSFQASYDLTSYLIDMGHTNIAFIGNLNYTNSVNDRYLGYYKALLEEGIDINPLYRIDDRDDFGIKHEFSLPKEMPTAFVCNNDHSAYLLICQIKKAGYRVPQDISVTGFDDIIYAEISKPPITSAHVKLKFMAEQAVGLIKRRLSYPESSNKTITIDCAIIYRQSVANICKNYS